MSKACQCLHEILSEWPCYRAGFDVTAIAQNGLYFLFEKGERGHGKNRIVRVGTHSGQNNLAKRIREHLFAANKDRSIFRKHIGRCLLTRENDSFLTQWNIDLTPRVAKDKHGSQIDKNRLLQAEKSVTEYMNANFSFVILEVKNVSKRLAIEESCIATIARCAECGPSKKWQGCIIPI